MKKLLTKQGITTALAAIGLTCALQANAAVFSTTKAELLYGHYTQRGNPQGGNKDQAILTLANYTAFSWGDSYWFMDVVDLSNREETGGIHMEWGPRVSLLRLFGKKPMEGFIKDYYLIGQLDFDGNKFVQKTILMGGVSADLNVPGFDFFKIHLQYRDDPKFAGKSGQLNWIWNAPFTVGTAKFTFEGFMDWTSSEGASHTNLLWQPQLMWHPTKHIAAGIEWQYWKNRLGIKNRDESTPQAIVRWTF